MSRKIGNAQSRATFFRHSAVLSLPAVLLRKLANVNNPVGRKRTHTLVAKSRARSSRFCGLSSVVYHGWEGKKGPK